jgi:hypothetical protein
MEKVIFILMMWVFVFLFMVKQKYDDLKYPNKPKIILYITWALMVLIGCVGSYYVIND